MTPTRLSLSGTVDGHVKATDQGKHEIALLTAVIVGVLTTLGLPGTVRAGGLEYPGAGTRVLGRGGAYHVRADDPLALRFNPANLAIVDGAQVTVQANNAFYDACFDRRLRAAEGDTYEALLPTNRFTSFDGFVEPGPGRTEFPGDDWGRTTLPTVCQEDRFAPSANLAMSLRLHERVGIAFGIAGPAAVGRARWGNGDGSVIAPGGVRVPSPGRYGLVEQNHLILHPTVGVGWSPTPWLRVGVALTWGIASIDFTTMAREVAGNESPDDDVRTSVTATDLFVPGVVLSVTAEPIDRLELMLGFQWNDAIDGSGPLRLDTGAFGIGEEGVGIPSRVPTRNNVGDARLRFSQPWVAMFGVRWHEPVQASPGDGNGSTIANLGGSIDDRMANEQWDIELNFRYEGSSAFQDVVVDVGSGQEARFVNVDGNGVLSATRLSVPTQIRVPTRWADQVSVRLGGDWNVLPGFVAVRAGASFETDGVNERYASLSFLPGMRLGLHGGLTVRVGRFDLSIAYAHLFQWDTVVSAEVAGLPLIEATSDSPGVEGAREINVGRFSAAYDVLSLGVNWHL